MSRNLLRDDCAFCRGVVALTGLPRLGTSSDFGRYAPQYEGMTIADAECMDCGAPYMAWLDERTRKSTSYHDDDRWRREGQPFVDLSHRNAFNDEPGDGDYPTREVVVTHRRDGSVVRESQ